jgi:photosystem II stability/assembly factor-like uncharacterized protein
MSKKLLSLAFTALIAVFLFSCKKDSTTSTSTTTITSGDNWQQIWNSQDPLIGFAISGVNIFALSEDSGVYLSTNQGVKWTAENNGFSLALYLSKPLAISGNYIFLGNGTNVYSSPISSISWSAVNTGLPKSNNIQTITTNGNNIYLGSDSGIYLSTNNGGSWKSLGLSTASVNYAIIFYFTIAINGNNIFVGTDQGVYLSTNNGSTWNNSSQGMPTGNYVHSFVFNGNNIFAGTETGLYVSTNNGSSWSLVNTGLPASNPGVAQVSINNGILYAGPSSNSLYAPLGVIISSNNGSTWSNLNNGWTTSYGGLSTTDELVQGFGFDNTYVYIATVDGVWRLPLSAK